MTIKIAQEPCKCFFFFFRFFLSLVGRKEGRRLISCVVCCCGYIVFWKRAGPAAATDWPGPAYTTAAYLNSPRLVSLCNVKSIPIWSFFLLFSTLRYFPPSKVAYYYLEHRLALLNPLVPPLLLLLLNVTDCRPRPFGIFMSLFPPPLYSQP